MQSLPRVARRPNPFTLPALCVILLIGIALAMERLPTAGLAGYAARARTELVLGQDKITKRNAAFLREGLLRMSHTFCAPEMLAANSAAALALYGQACPAPDEARLNVAFAPSTALLPPMDEMAPEGVTVISIVCRSDHLFDPQHGIVTHPLDTGRSSERPAWLSARLGSKLLVESPIGLRIHGGNSRTAPDKSFSLVFREAYGGHDSCEPGLFFGPDTPEASHIVLLNAANPARFNAALATEISGLLGCETSRLAPALVYLNGTQIKTPFFLYQHQSEDFVKQRHGLAELDWVRLKANRETENPAYVAWRRWIRRDRCPVLLKEEAARYDIEDLNAWVLSMTFTSASDCNQGAYFRDRANPKAVWRSLVWDMDFSFINYDRHPNQRALIYAEDPIKMLSGDRARLFHRLMAHSTEYREYFRKFASETLEAKLPQDKLMALADGYLDLARKHPASNPEIVRVMEETRAFLATRRDFYLPYLEKRLQESKAAGLVLYPSGSD